MRSGALLAGVATLAIVGSAAGQTPGWYVEGGFGISFDGEQDLVGEVGGLGSIRFGHDPDLGYAGAARVGYAWGNGLRLEGEIGYRSGSGDISSTGEVCIASIPCFPVDLDSDLDGLLGGDWDFDLESETQVLSGLANLYYDFGGLAGDVAVIPYVGIGGGVALIDNDVTISGSFTNGGTATGSISGDGAELAPAIQLIAGVNVPIDSNLSFGVDYRYFRAFTGDIEHDEFSATFGGSINGSLAVDGDYESHTVMAALRYAFGGPDMPDMDDGPNGMEPVGYSGRGWYVEGAGGISFAGEQDLFGELNAYEIGGPGSFSGSATLDHDPDVGYVVAARAGYGWDNGLRFEGEIAYHATQGDISPIVELCASGSACTTVNLDTIGDGSLFDTFDLDVDLSSDTQVLAGMANAYYDFLDVQEDWGFTPYIGAGAGIALADNDVEIGITGSATDPQGGGAIGLFDATVSGDGAELAPAVQLIAGVNVPIDNHWSVSIDYRYFRAFTGDIEHNEIALYEPLAIDTGANATLAVDGDFQSHNVMAALRYTWGEPIYQAPEPMPEPVAAQTEFMVFFDWDESVLTSEANNTLDEVVVVYDGNGFAQVNLAGHTDTSGPTGYNQDLGLRRAESVRQGLVARGVAPDEIVVRSFGESQLLVPTADGVREPQNRRVEIVLL